MKVQESYKNMLREHRLFFTLLLICSGLILFTLLNWMDTEDHVSAQKINRTSSAEASKKGRIERDRYYNRLLQDPATGSVPEGTRNRELSHLKQLQSQSKYKGGPANTLSSSIIWDELGPDDVGGRTRALALDIADASGNTIIAGGVSGGIWKSTNGGTSWERKTDHSQHASVTTLVQYPTDLKCMVLRQRRI
mgnify:FL=1